MRLTHYDKNKKRWQVNIDYGAVMIDALNYAVGEAIDNLAAYENAKEQGLFIRLPCKVGDTLYAPTRNIVSEFRVSQFVYGGYGKSSLWVNWHLEKGFTGNFRIDGIRASEIGKTVFLSREEAEAALKEGRDDADNG